MTSPALRYAHVSVAYGELSALTEVSLTIPAGTTTALLGVNGAGKSTLLRATLDLIRVRTGTIEIQGTPHTEPRARSGLAYLPERVQPPHYLTGREFIAGLLGLHGVAYDPQRAARECAALDLDADALERRARTYSKGMAQKLGLIACLMADRRVLLLDEPMSGLDPLAHEACTTRLHAARGSDTTLVFSTHALHDVVALAERVVVIHAGRVRFDDTLATFLAAAPDTAPERAFMQIVGA